MSNSLPVSESFCACACVQAHDSLNHLLTYTCRHTLRFTLVHNKSAKHIFKQFCPYCSDWLPDKNVWFELPVPTRSDFGVRGLYHAHSFPWMQCPLHVFSCLSCWGAHSLRHASGIHLPDTSISQCCFSRVSCQNPWIFWGFLAKRLAKPIWTHLIFQGFSARVFSSWKSGLSRALLPNPSQNVDFSRCSCQAHLKMLGFLGVCLCVCVFLPSPSWAAATACYCQMPAMQPGQVVRRTIT